LTDLNGILIVNKPQGWTSHDVVKKTRNLLGVSKVGHTGTLDPMATGVLVLLIGTATKVARYFENDRKRYVAEITFGRATDTYDNDGRTTATDNPMNVDVNVIKTAIVQLEGDSEQIPPMFSALKVGGKKLYRLARAGKIVDRKPRKINISSIEYDLSTYPRITLGIECSKGTYIRSIAHQLGEMVGCPSHLSALKRSASGDYTIEDAVDFLSLCESTGHGNIERLIRPVSDMEFMI
jgi:tRNA pseudouridine55 synthase